MFKADGPPPTSQEGSRPHGDDPSSIYAWFGEPYATLRTPAAMLRGTGFGSETPHQPRGYLAPLRPTEVGFQYLTGSGLSVGVMTRRIYDRDTFDLDDHVRLSVISLILRITGPELLPRDLLTAQEPLTQTRAIAIGSREISCTAMVYGDVEACGAEFGETTVTVASFRRAFTANDLTLELFPPGP